MPRDRTTSQTLSLLFGVVFLLVGIAGFIPGITTNYDELAFATTDSKAELLGFVQISVLHNIVHALFGVGILAARAPSTARTYLLGSGLIYAVLFVYGLFVGNESDANFVPISNIDDFAIHLPLAVALLASWYATRNEETAPRATAAPM